MFVVLDGLDGPLGDGRHARLRDGRLQLVERGQLLVERLYGIHRGAGGPIHEHEGPYKRARRAKGGRRGTTQTENETETAMACWGATRVTSTSPHGDTF